MKIIPFAMKKSIFYFTPRKGSVRLFSSSVPSDGNSMKVPEAKIKPIKAVKMPKIKNNPNIEKIILNFYVNLYDGDISYEKSLAQDIVNDFLAKIEPMKNNGKSYISRIFLLIGDRQIKQLSAKTYTELHTFVKQINTMAETYNKAINSASAIKKQVLIITNANQKLAQFLNTLRHSQVTEIADDIDEFKKYIGSCLREAKLTFSTEIHNLRQTQVFIKKLTNITPTDIDFQSPNSFFIRMPHITTFQKLVEKPIITKTKTKVDIEKAKKSFNLKEYDDNAILAIIDQAIGKK